MTAAPLYDLADYGDIAAPLPFEWANQITFDPEGVSEIVEDVFVAGAMSMTYGESNSGKSTCMLDLGFRMPTGKPWLGKRTVLGSVMYVAAEGAHSVRMRLEAYRRTHGPEVHGFGIVPTSVNLLDPSADVDRLIDLILRESSHVGYPAIALVIVDTTARVMAGANENASEDMSRLISAGDRIRGATGAHLNWVHHSGKNASLGARGHSSLRAAIDTELEVTEDGGVHTIEITKQRDLGSRGERLTARFRAVELGLNRWQKPITACVVEPVEQVSQHMKTLIDQNASRHAQGVVIDGFRRLVAMGLEPTDGSTSPRYLPRMLADKGLHQQLERPLLTRALNDLMTAGRFRIGDTATRYGNGQRKKGLILGDA